MVQREVHEEFTRLGTEPAGDRPPRRLDAWDTQRAHHYYLLVIWHRVRQHLDRRGVVGTTKVAAPRWRRRTRAVATHRDHVQAVACLSCRQCKESRPRQMLDLGAGHAVDLTRCDRRQSWYAGHRRAADSQDHDTEARAKRGDGTGAPHRTWLKISDD